MDTLILQNGGGGGVIAPLRSESIQFGIDSNTMDPSQMDQQVRIYPVQQSAQCSKEWCRQSLSPTTKETLWTSRENSRSHSKPMWKQLTDFNANPQEDHVWNECLESDDDCHHVQSINHRNEINFDCGGLFESRSSIGTEPPPELEPNTIFVDEMDGLECRTLENNKEPFHRKSTGIEPVKNQVLNKEQLDQSSTKFTHNRPVVTPNDRLLAAAEKSRATLQQIATTQNCIPPSRGGLPTYPHLHCARNENLEKIENVSTLVTEFSSTASLPFELLETSSSSNLSESEGTNILDSGFSLTDCVRTRRHVTICNDPDVVLFSEDDRPRDICRRVTMKRRLRWRIREWRQALVRGLNLETDDTNTPTTSYSPSEQSFHHLLFHKIFVDGSFSSNSEGYQSYSSSEGIDGTVKSLAQ